ncbi:hypothetical protein [Streptosporangium sp. NPDC049046]|uniref:hypothetical protein n=1 Tax=Streptosporangium sp. NPDC049046 TaxID=3155031 RepID=UPI00342848D3
MSSRPRIRVPVTLDPDLVDYVKDSLGDGDLILSSYVNDALAARVREERRRKALLQVHVSRARETVDHGRVDRMMAHVKQQLKDVPGFSDEAAR